MSDHKPSWEVVNVEGKRYISVNGKLFDPNRFRYYSWGGGTASTEDYLDILEDVHADMVKPSLRERVKAAWEAFWGK